MHRAYSLLDIKAFDADRHVITGIATTPTPDRMGDVIDPMGAQFANPLPLLLFHDTERPVGTVTFDTPTAKGIGFTATLPEITDAGPLKDRVSEAWASVKAGLIRGVSIGFRSLADGIEQIKGTGGLRFKAIEVLELSLVVVPANAEATISTIKSVDQRARAASGQPPRSSSTAPGVSGRVVSLATKDATAMKKTVTEQIKGFQETRDAKDAERQDLMAKAADEGVTLDVEQSERYDQLTAEIKSCDEHLVRLRDLEASQKKAAVPVSGESIASAAASRDGQPPVVTVKSNLPPGIEFSRAMMCKLASFVSGNSVSPVEVAKDRYPDNPRIQTYLKGAVAAGSTTSSIWAGALVDQTNLASEFIDFLRPMTIIGKFGTNGIPSLRRIPFNVRIVGQDTGGSGYWVGEGAPKPLTAFEFSATTLLWSKVAAIAVITEELARFSSPSAEALVRDSLAQALVARIDTDFVDPTVAAVANVSPASITNGLTPLTTAGTSADNARTDLQNLLETFILNNINPMNLVLIMPNTLALALSVLVNALGQPEFPGLTMNGGTLKGIPVITSQYAANQSGAGNMVIAVNASDIFLADDGQVSVDVSRDASLQMLNNPTNNSVTATATTMVSMWQTNSMALRAERFINWSRRRTAAVAYMDDVNWGSIGSPS